MRSRYCTVATCIPAAAVLNGWYTCPSDGFFGSHAGNLEAWEAEFCAARSSADADEQALPWG